MLVRGGWPSNIWQVAADNVIMLETSAERGLPSVSVSVLYYGDNLNILRDHERVPDASIDLIYLDPPFNSDRDYNVLFEERDATESEAQIRAFEDCWHWNPGAESVYRELTDADAESRGVPARLVTLMESFYRFLGPRNDMMAYLVMMAIRLIELRRVLKPTGSLYLHCDPTASHYIKLVLDAVFGPERFQTEIVWQRTGAKGLMTRRLPNNHDIIFAYRKGDEATWNADAVFRKHDPENLDEKTASKYCHADPDGRLYRLDNLINPNQNRPNLTYEFLGVRKVWRWTKDRMEAAYRAGLVVQTKPSTVPQLKRYLDTGKGRPLGDVWTDIPPLNSQAKERLGYPTQKPLALLERIIALSSNEGDVVLDPFCGCGTAVHAAQNLRRKWIGIDITHVAIGLIEDRMRKAHRGINFAIDGIPADVASARDLAESEPYKFQDWVIFKVGARPVASMDPAGKQSKRGMDRGIDGVIRFRDDPNATQSQRVIVSVKGGKGLSPTFVRDLRGTIEREGAPIGALVTMYEPTREMRLEATKAGTWRSPTWNREYDRIQLVTVEELFGGKRVEYPGANVTLKSAPTEMPRQEQLSLVTQRRGRRR